MIDIDGARRRAGDFLRGLRRATRQFGQPKIIGCVEGHRRDAFCGWAFELADPRRRLVVEIVADIGRWRVQADRHRADIHRAHPATDGYCGFAVPVTMLSSVRRVEVFCGEPKVALPPARRDLTVRTGGAFRRGACSGFIDIDSVGKGVSGWVCNSIAADWRGLVSLTRNGSVVVSRPATLYREEARQASADGFYGFSFPPIDDAQGTWELVESSSGLALPMRP